MTFRPIYKFRSWFNTHPTKLDYEELLNNERCCDVLEKYDMVNIEDLSRHSGAISFIESNFNSANMCELAGNIAAGHLLNRVFKIAIQELENNCFANNCKTVIYNLVENPSAMHIIKQMFYQTCTSLHNNTINWKTNREFVKRLCYNENAVELLEQLPPEIINFEALAENENAVHLMERWIDHWKNVPHIWSQLCFNKNSIELLIKYPDYINWFSLVQNESDDAVDLVIKGQVNVLTYTRLIKNLYLLSQNNNPKAYELYKKLINRERDNVSKNVFGKNHIRETDIWIAKNPCAINDIETYLKLCENDEDCTNYITELIEQGLLQNPELYILDYEAMKNNINKPIVNDLSFVEELIRVTLKPLRVHRYKDEYNYDILLDEYFE
jgi:tetratricopeptide (TPR) repeat protein